MPLSRSLHQPCTIRAFTYEGYSGQALQKRLAIRPKFTNYKWAKAERRRALEQGSLFAWKSSLVKPLGTRGVLTPEPPVGLVGSLRRMKEPPAAGELYFMS